MEEIIKWMTLDTQANDYTDTLVPYRFCSDEYVSALGLRIWDEGADPYEMVSYAICGVKITSFSPLSVKNAIWTPSMFTRTFTVESWHLWQANIIYGSTTSGKSHRIGVG